MLHINDRLKKPEVRGEHFRYRPGRLTDKLIVETIRKRISQIINQGFRGGGAFTTEQLLYPLWQEQPTQHHYISQQISRLIEEYELPIRKVAVKGDSHVLYKVILDTL